MAIDLSKNYKHLTSSPTDSMEFAKKPEWYHRRPISCSNSVTPSFRARAPLSSFNPGEHVHCKDIPQGQEPLSSYMTSPIVPGLDLYCDRVHRNLWRESFYNPVQNDDPDPESSGGEESDSGTDVIFLVSSAKDSLSSSPRSPFIQGSIVEPLSPAASSLEEEGGCCHLSQPLSSPSPDSSYSEDSSDSSVNIPVHHNRPVVLLSDIYSHAAESPVNVSSDDSDVFEVSVTGDGKECHTMSTRKQLPQDERPRFHPREVRRSARITKPAVHATQLTCEAPRYSLRKQVRNIAVGIYNESCDSDDMLQYVARLSTQEAAKMSLQPDDSQGDSSRPEESNVEITNERNSTLRTQQQQQQQPPCCDVSDSDCKSKQQKPSTLHKSDKLRQIKRKQKHAVASQNNGEAKKRTVARRKKRSRTRQCDPFSRAEPEITLKFAKIKAKKKIWKCDNFCPFVHMEHRKCTVVNFQEEVNVTRNHGGEQQSTNTSSLPGFVPSTSCFQLGRVCLENRVQDPLFCSLCGHTANAMGLGDLHGPYLPSGSSVKVDKNCATVEAGDDDFHRLTNSVSSSENRCCGHERSPVVRHIPDCNASPLPKGNVQVNESWIHEDCGIWSAGVFLVKGKLYGLQEAAQLARQTVSEASENDCKNVFLIYMVTFIYR